MRTRSIAIVLFAFTALACEGPATSPTDVPQFDFMNGPDELPNVIRSQFAFAVSILDPATGLRVIAGLPAVPASHISCQALGPQFTGTENFQLQNEQFIGSDPLVYLNHTANVNLHVYRTSTFMGFCRSTVYAQGTGTVVGTDNDFTGSGPRTNAYGFHITGDVTVVATGETARLNAFYRFQFTQSGGIQILARKVQLN